jgi:hypothetical protein
VTRSNIGINMHRAIVVTIGQRLIEVTRTLQLRLRACSVRLSQFLFQPRSSSSFESAPDIGKTRSVLGVLTVLRVEVNGVFSKLEVFKLRLEVLVCKCLY